jgi:hypothetical protein
MPERVITMTEEQLTPEEEAERKLRHEHFLRNVKWFEEHAIEIGQKYPGKHVVVAGGELFVGDTFRETRDRASLAHPEDQGVFIRYIPADRGPRLYAHLRRMDR